MSNDQEHRFQQAAESINQYLATCRGIVKARWNGENPVILCNVKAEKQEDGWHLKGYDSVGKEYCIGDAVVTLEYVLYYP